jgi:hypothetical protein
LEEQVNVIALIAERKIVEAMAQGAFDNLPGAGKPLPEDDLAMWPEESRLALRILRSSNFANFGEEGGLTGSFEPQAAEAGLISRRMTRLELALSKGPRASSPKASGPKAPSRERSHKEPGEPLEASGAIFDSPYLAKILEKLFG